MAVLTRKEIERRLHNEEMLHKPRPGKDGHFDVEVDSYDLAAGTAIWKQPPNTSGAGTVKTLRYLPEVPAVGQPTVTVHPGQMIFVVTLEDILMPTDLCGTVYSRNSLALHGILALNAGHVDSGYHGPIAIRLINLRAIPWTLTLGEPVFTITFQTVDVDTRNTRGSDRLMSQEEMIFRVRDTADASLSNALYDLYADNIDKRLNEFRLNAVEEFRKEMDIRWVRQDNIWSVLFNSLWKKVLATILIATALAGIAGAIFTVISFFVD